MVFLLTNDLSKEKTSLLLWTTISGLTMHWFYYHSLLTTPLLVLLLAYSHIEIRNEKLQLQYLSFQIQTSQSQFSEKLNEVPTSQEVDVAQKQKTTHFSCCESCQLLC